MLGEYFKSQRSVEIVCSELDTKRFTWRVGRCVVSTNSEGNINSNNSNSNNDDNVSSTINNITVIEHSTVLLYYCIDSITIVFIIR